MLRLAVLFVLGMLKMVDGGTFGAPLQMTVDANGMPEYYCTTGDEYLNIGERIRTSYCYDCSCSYRYGLNCVSIGSALHRSAHIRGCRLVELPNCCYKYVKIRNPERDCIPETCP